MKLPPRQRKALEQLQTAGWASACQLRANLATMNALERRWLVSARRGLGDVAMPDTAIRWAITAAGRAALAKT